mmetsp:Transcript_15486/g.37436  ORF Transcript_15486/g.37436 Transcript_15486/m.37436 type:complete len:307 (-) Transcript_15486:217-1137(-)
MPHGQQDPRAVGRHLDKQRRQRARVNLCGRGERRRAPHSIRTHRAPHVQEVPPSGRPGLEPPLDGERVAGEGRAGAQQRDKARLRDAAAVAAPPGCQPRERDRQEAAPQGLVEEHGRPDVERLAHAPLSPVRRPPRREEHAGEVRRRVHCAQRHAHDRERCGLGGPRGARQVNLRRDRPVEASCVFEPRQAAAPHVLRLPRPRCVVGRAVCVPQPHDAKHPVLRQRHGRDLHLQRGRHLRVAVEELRRLPPLQRGVVPNRQEAVWRVPLKEAQAALERCLDREVYHVSPALPAHSPVAVGTPHLSI